MTTTNRLAVITGGSRGLGKNAALHLAKSHVDSIITYRSHPDEATAVVAELERAGVKAAALPFDAGKSSSFEGFVSALKQTLHERFGRQRFDFLVNNAGHGLMKPFADTTEGELDELYAVHLKAPYLLTQKLLPLLADGGRVLNVSTGLARFAMPGYSAYAAMKGAIEVLTRYQAKELGARGISVNVIAPGAIETDFGGGHVRDNPQLNQMIGSFTALGRAGKPDDIGGVIASLLAGDTKWINGQRVEASGGMNL
jgi:NAD(P)-dependent dehydrogenase (short-subunit alcohol dehydrogenase family)